MEQRGGGRTRARCGARRYFAGDGTDGSFAAYGGGLGYSRVPIPSDDSGSRPEARVGLLALATGKPVQGVDAPAGADRAGARIGLAERRGIGTPRDTRPHLAP